MRNNVLRWGFMILPVVLLLSMGFDDDPYFISARDIKWKIPKGFPKPTYDFSKNKLSPQGFVLGRMLFYDPILSKDSTVSCASCHQSFAAFAHIDHKLSHGIDNRIGTRNVPALQNLIWKKNFMWDGGVNHLEIQPFSPITSKAEMDESLENVVAKLQRSNRYQTLFAAAFKDTLVSSEKIFQSLAQFTGLMISANSKYDQFMRKELKLNEMELKGLALFNQKCNSCHTAPLFTNNDFANNGMAADSVLKDMGRAKITGKQADEYRFSIPSLRNVEVSYPYMHDGRFSKLQQVVTHYQKLNKNNPDLSPSLRAIGVITDSNKIELVAFLKTLTDKSFLNDKRFVLPISKP